MNKYVVNMQNLNIYPVVRMGEVEGSVVINQENNEVHIHVDNENYRYLNLIY